MNTPALGRVRALAARALARVLVRTGAAPDASQELPGLVRLWFQRKGVVGGAAMATAVGLQPSGELAAFEATLRSAERTEKRQGENAQAEERNALLASFRVLAWIETIGARTNERLLDGEIDAVAAEDVGRKQVRAIELIVRSLIAESYADETRLRARLDALMGPRVVESWQARADAGDILSGLAFSELASLFANKEEFARYEGLYAKTPFLTLYEQRRKTIQSFLDDIRRVRNQLAHHKHVSNVQWTLLDLYYEEIAAPVQAAFDEGQTKVDPSVLLDVDRSALDAHFGTLREDLESVRDDMAEFRAATEERLGAIAADTKTLRKTSRGIDRRVWALCAGVAALLVGVFLVVRQGDETRSVVEEVRETGAQTDVAVREAAQASLASEAASREAAAASRSAADAAARGEAEARETAARVDEAAGRVAEAAGASSAAADAAREAAATAGRTAERVEEAVGDLREAFLALRTQDGTIVDADRPEAHYHNARVYEQRGDILQAMQAYARYFATPELAFVDPHFRYQALLKLQQGVAGARETYHAMRKGSPHPTIELAWTLLLDDGARAAALEAFLERHPDDAPAHFAAARESSVARLGVQNLEDRRREKHHLERFVALANGPGFLERYLDPAVASAALDDARERLAAVDAAGAAVLENPVRMTASRSNTGWMLVFQISDAVKEISWRARPADAFRSTGFMEGMLSPAGLPMPKTFVELEHEERATIQVRYVDARGREHGPYDLVFDPLTASLAQAKSTLDMTKRGWATFRDWDGKVLLYFTHLLGHRIALETIRYGLDKDEPDQTFAFLPPDPKNPNAIREDDTIYLVVPPTTRWVVLQLHFKDGTQTEVVRLSR